MQVIVGYSYEESCLSKEDFGNAQEGQARAYG